MSLPYPQRLYRSGDAESLHRYTLIPDHPDFARARLNALHLSDVSEPQSLGVCLFLSDYLCPNWMLFVNKKKKSWEVELGTEGTLERKSGASCM